MNRRRTERRFAEGTTVPPENSQAEIRRLVNRYGADEFALGETATSAVVGFTAHGRRVSFTLTFPKPGPVVHGGRGRKPDPLAVVEAEKRRLWRCLALLIKSKLEAVATGLAIFEEEFLAHVVLPGGGRVMDHVGPLVAQAYERGSYRGLLPEATDVVDAERGKA